MKTKQTSNFSNNIRKRFLFSKIIFYRGQRTRRLLIDVACVAIVKLLFFSPLYLLRLKNEMLAICLEVAREL